MHRLKRQNQAVVQKINSLLNARLHPSEKKTFAEVHFFSFFPLTRTASVCTKKEQGREAEARSKTERKMKVTNGQKVTVVGCAKIEKVCDYNGNRWMWIDLQGFKMRINENTAMAKWLDAKWVTNVGAKTGGTIKATPVGFVGTVKDLPKGGATLVDRKLLDLAKFGVFIDEEGDAEKMIAKAEANIGLEID